MKKINISRFIPVFLAILLTFAYVIKIHFGLHWDEPVSIANGDVVVKQNHFISENWSTLQFTGLFLYPFIRIFQLFSSSSDGIILYFRYFFIFIQILVSLYTYITIKHTFSQKKACLISLASFLYFFNWTTLNYKAFLYWFTWICLLSIMNYLSKTQIRYILLAAFSLSASVLSYIGSIVIFIPCCIALYKLDTNHRKKSIAVFAGTCIACASIVVSLIMGDCGLSNFFNGIHQIITSEAYTEGVFSKLLRVSLPIIAMIVAITVLLHFANRIRTHLTKQVSLELIAAVFGGLGFIILCIAKFQTITASRVWYCFLLIFSFLPFFLSSEEKANKNNKTNIIRYLFLYPTLFMILGINISSNQGIAISAYGCILGLYGILLLQKEKSPITLLVIGLLLFAFLYFVPDQNPAHSTIFTAREKMGSGPAKGIYVISEVKAAHDELCLLTDTYVSHDDRLLILSNNYSALGYINTAAKYAAYSPCALEIPPTTEKMIDFYQRNPHLLPTIILIDKREIISFDEWSSSNVGNYLLTHTKYEYQESGNYIILQSDG